ncbi:MAG: hypothetical protein A2277_04760 [Desulfobacterales bacterium RIFOXYA12_FULL_46_15]|nr:MAG: hypothetical protein A2097_08465 [Desulfobacula sp. GWF2_41_7]OGR25320.1 MAG: hypothetical protein A2277_04760 [Desulfobacterales bacterium RIFOXYA12_FULL_46_15]
MIVGEHKPIEEIIESVKEYSNVLVVGCQTCVAVSLTGGDRPVVFYLRFKRFHAFFIFPLVCR